MLRGILEILALLAITFAWVSGQLDPLQKRLQEILLDTMGETKISYGLKSEAFLHIQAKRIVADNHQKV
jgi:hypothetical protein